MNFACCQRVITPFQESTLRVELQPRCLQHKTLVVAWSIYCRWRQSWLQRFNLSAICLTILFTMLFCAVIGLFNVWNCSLATRSITVWLTTCWLNLVCPASIHWLLTVVLDYLISVSLHRTVSLDIYAAYNLLNVCVLSTVCLSLYVFVCFVFLCSMGWSLK